MGLQHPKMLAYMFDRDIDIEVRLSTFFINIGIVAAIVGVLLCVIAHCPWYGTLATASIPFGAIVVLRIGVRLNWPIPMGTAMACGLVLIMPVIFITCGGSTGGAPIRFVYELFYIALFARKREFAPFFLCACSLIAVCFALEWFMPSAIFHFTNEIDARVDLIGSIICVSATVIITTMAQKSIYVHEKKLSDEKERTTLEFVTAVANIVDAKDRYTSSHSHRVAIAAREISRKMGLPDDQVEDMYFAGLLHDIGKIGVPDSVLNKPDKLTDSEYRLVKSHTTLGGELLKDFGFIGFAYECALHHHERWDGKGYPDGLAGTDIPQCARILAVADAYDAMSMNRVYRRHLSDVRIIEEFEQCAGTQFDPEIAAVFLTMLKSGFAIDLDSETTTVTEKLVSSEARRLIEALVANNQAVAREPLLSRMEGEVSRGHTPTPIMQQEEFIRVYRYLYDLGRRQNNEITLACVSFEWNESLPEKEAARAMICLGQAIQEMIRSVDVCTPYDESGYLIMMLNMKEESLESAMQRIFQSFYNIYGSSDIALSYRCVDNNNLPQINREVRVVDHEGE